MKKNHLIIATRESPLALWQANWVKTRLEQAQPGLTVNLLGMTTQADRQPYLSLAEVGGKGLFVKELEDALLSGRADIAVHSMKDMPVVLPPGLCLPVICERETPWDALVSNHYPSLQDLPSHAVVGTSSLRRQSQLLALRADLRIQPLRGNVNTRLSKLDEGAYSAIILAAAGLHRLGLEQRIQQVLGREIFLPSAGQGALGVECREDDVEVQTLIASLNHAVTAQCVRAERAMCQALGVGCQTPVAAYAELKQEKIYLQGFVASVDGKRVLQAEASALPATSEQAGITVAKMLLAKGAEEILNSLRK